MTKLISSTSTVVACAVLHNMSLIFNDVLPEDDDFNDEDNEDVPVVERAKCRKCQWLCCP